MTLNDKNTVGRPKRANAGKNPNLEDFSVFGIKKAEHSNKNFVDSVTVNGMTLAVEESDTESEMDIDDEENQCRNCGEIYPEEEMGDIDHCHACFRTHRAMLTAMYARKERDYEEVVWPENAQTFSRIPLTQPQFITRADAVIDLTIPPESGTFWRFESDSNIIVID